VSIPTIAVTPVESSFTPAESPLIPSISYAADIPTVPRERVSTNDSTPLASQDFSPALYTDPSPSTLSEVAVPAMMETPDFSLPLDGHTLEAFFNFTNTNDEDDDGEFLPGSSPHFDSEDDEKETPRVRGKKRSKNDDEEDDEEEEFVDEDVEDEDLFLPIIDVPVPEEFREGAMKSLGVEDQGEFAELIEKVVEAGKTKEGVTPEVLEKLKVLLGMAGRGIRH
jgi:hypothetical protein